MIPARAPVITERIETEFRTASGITDGQGHFIAGVVLITAGYSADGKYSHYFVSQVPLKVGDFLLPPGQYLIGWVRGQDSLKVTFYQAQSGKPVGQVEATRNLSITRVESFRIWPPGGQGADPAGPVHFQLCAGPLKLALARIPERGSDERAESARNGSNDSKLPVGASLLDERWLGFGPSSSAPTYAGGTWRHLGRRLPSGRGYGTRLR